MSVVLVGISHHQAPIELRERAALDPVRAGELARRLAGDEAEAVCLSTCNRTELYLASEAADEAEDKAEAALLALEAELGPALYRLRDESRGIDAVTAATFATLVVYAGYVASRSLLGWQGRRAAYLALVGFALVIVVRLALPATHFA